MKNWIQKLVNYYNTNAKFHSFVLALEYAASSFITAQLVTGGVPMTKRALVTAGAGLAGALIAAGKRWLATNLATQNLQLKSQ